MGFGVNRGQGTAEAIGAVTASSRGTIVPSGGSTGSKGGWTSLGTTTKPAAGFFLYAQYGEGEDWSNILLDIALGATSSEEILIENIPLANWTSTGAGDHTEGGMFIPLPIPDGVQVSARTVTAGNGAPHDIVVSLVTVPHLWHDTLPLGACETYGATVSTALGTSATASTAHTRAWTEIVASTTEPIKALYVCVQVDANNADTGSDVNNFLLSVAVGGSGSEEEIVHEFPVRKHDNAIHFPFHGPFYVDIPASTRLAIGVRSESVASDIDEVQIVLLGLR